MKKQSEITDATRDALITAFFQLAEIKNIHRITIKEITNLAGYNRTTFYRYFVDVYALIEYAEDALIDGMLSDFLVQIETRNAMDDRFFQMFLGHFRANRGRLSILLCDQNRVSFIRRLQEKIILTLNGSIADNSHNRIVMDIYFTGIFSALATHMEKPGHISDDELMDLIRRLFTRWYWPEVTGNY